MRAIRSKGTKMEIILGRALWTRGYRYRKNVASIFGKPDFVLKKFRLAIFVDSEFFHGKDWDSAKFAIKTRRDFWWGKIEGNISRDNHVSKGLKEEGWTVLRFWSNEIRRDVCACVERIEKAIQGDKDG